MFLSVAIWRQLMLRIRICNNTHSIIILAISRFEKVGYFLPFNRFIHCIWFIFVSFPVWYSK